MAKCVEKLELTNDGGSALGLAGAAFLKIEVE